MMALDRRCFFGLVALMAAPRIAIAGTRGHVAYVADMPWFDASGVAPASYLPLIAAPMNWLNTREML